MSKSKQQQQSIVGMNINDFTEKYGFRGSVEHMGFCNYFVTYRKSTGKIVSVDTESGKRHEYKKPRLYHQIGGGRFVKMPKSVRVAAFPTAQIESGKQVRFA